MKSTMLLATAVFLISAPAPDSSDVAELTSNFIVPETIPGLMAAEQSPGGRPLETEQANSEKSSGLSGPGESGLSPDMDDSGVPEIDRQGS